MSIAIRTTLRVNHLQLLPQYVVTKNGRCFVCYAENVTPKKSAYCERMEHH